jgi:hypothetical protein
VPLPPDYNTVPVFCKYAYLDGTVPTGTVKFKGKGVAVSDAYNTVIMPTEISVELVDGEFTVNLPATDDPDIQPNGWTYTVTEQFNKGGERSPFEIEVPLGSLPTGIDLSEVAPAPADSNPTAFVTLSAFEENTKFTKEWTRTGDASVVTGELAWTNPFSRTLDILGVILSAGTAPTGADLVMDTNKDGVTIYTTQANRPRIPAGQLVGTLAVPDVVTLAPGERITFDIDAVGSSTPGADITATIVLR